MDPPATSAAARIATRLDPTYDAKPGSGRKGRRTMSDDASSTPPTRPSIASARQDPDAYIARYRALSPPARVAYVRGLSDDELALHLDVHYERAALTGGRPSGFDVRIERERGAELDVLIRLRGSLRTDDFAHLSASASRFAAVDAWMRSKGVRERTLVTSGDRWRSLSLDERIEAIRAFVAPARLVGLSVSDLVPRSDRGEPPHGFLRIVAFFREDDGSTWTCTVHERELGQDDYAPETQRAYAWAREAAARLGCELEEHPDPYA